MVQAFTSLLQQHPNIKLLLVGDLEKELDPLLPETITLIENTPEIISTGWQDDIRPYLATSDIFTFPSYREGFPNVVLQAGAMELPCIVSNINGCNEIIQHGENGEIIPAKNTTGLQQAMLRLLKDTNYRNSLKSNSRLKIIKKYEQKFVWNELLTLYDSLLKKIVKADYTTLNIYLKAKKSELSCLYIGQLMQYKKTTALPNYFV